MQLPIRVKYAELNPPTSIGAEKVDVRLDRELRADSKDSGLRVKTSKRLFSSQDAREEHVGFAKRQVRELLVQSVDIRRFGDSDAVRANHVAAFWDKIFPPNTGGDRVDKPLTLRKVLQLCELVEALPQSNVYQHSARRED